MLETFPASKARGEVEVVEREVDAMKQAVVKVEGALPPLTEQEGLEGRCFR